jgi:eukaryotic-like serine/threonine-protein kinase
MAIQPGTILGSYEILQQIGAGGMGEVYRANDRRLGRQVAIKALPAQLSGQEDLRQRFEREAQVIAGLNHPHICTLYDVGKQDGTDFLVMELLEGETIAARLERGPMPLEEALRFAIQIADALEKAHSIGITDEIGRQTPGFRPRQASRDHGVVGIRHAHRYRGSDGAWIDHRNSAIHGA